MRKVLLILVLALVMYPRDIGINFVRSYALEPSDGMDIYTELFSVGDLDGDGYDDILVVTDGFIDYSIVSIAKIYWGCPDPDELFTEYTILPFGVSIWNSPANVGDTDGSGRDDLVLLKRCLEEPEMYLHAVVVRFDEDRDYSITYLETYHDYESIRRDIFSLGNFDGLHHNDILISEWAIMYDALSLNIFNSDSTGNFSSVSFFSGPGFRFSFAEVNDFTGNGFKDIFLRSGYYGSYTDAFIFGGVHYDEIVPVFTGQEMPLTSSFDLGYDGKVEMITRDTLVDSTFVWAYSEDTDSFEIVYAIPATELPLSARRMLSPLCDDSIYFHCGLTLYKLEADSSFTVRFDTTITDMRLTHFAMLGDLTNDGHQEFYIRKRDFGVYDSIFIYTFNPDYESSIKDEHTPIVCNELKSPIYHHGNRVFSDRTISLYDIKGRMIRQGKAIDTKSLRNGIYIANNGEETKPICIVR